MPDPLWGVNEQGTRQHAFVERPLFDWRTFIPRALCGKAWSPTNPPAPVEGLDRCRSCERLAGQPTQQQGDASGT